MHGCLYLSIAQSTIVKLKRVTETGLTLTINNLALSDIKSKHKFYIVNSNYELF